MTFLNPLLLAGLAAVAIPIAIHLFNFRRPQRIDFSTLRFLREIEATAMRRVRIRQWLLLALRALAVVFLVLAFARPVPTADAGAFEAGAARSLVVVLDNSRSMTLRDAQGALLDQAKTTAAALIDATGRGDERTVLPTAPPAGYRPVPFTTPGPALDGVAATEALAGAEPLTAAVARAGSVLDGALHPRREVVVLSDLQAATFTDSVSAALPPDVDVTLIPFGGRRQVNTAVTDVRVVSRIIEPGRPVQVEATVARYGGRPGTVGASLSLDGQRVAETAVDVVPGTPTTARFTVTPPARGWLGGEVRIEADAAEWDDARSFALRVPPPPRVLIVRGDGQRADLVTLALGVTAEGGGVALNEIDEGALPGADLDRYDAVVLVGPRDVGASAGRLEAFVANGGGVLAFPGDQPEALNPLLQAVGGGRIDGVMGERGGAPIGTTTDADLEHPLFAGVFDASRPALEQVDVAQAARYRPGGGDESTLIGLQAGPPFLQEIRRGEGSVLLVAVAPDLAWSDLPQRGLFVPLLYRAAAYLAAGSVVGETGGADGTVRVEGVDAGQPLRLVGPDGITTTPLQRTVPGAVVLDLDDATARAGLYRVVQGERTLRVVAVNEDARESDPAALDPAVAAERLEAVTGRPVRVLDAAPAALSAGGAAGTPLWTVSLALALACLLAETALTTRWKKAAAPPAG
ncbi:BatA and WFA domain-containing protein [Rubrivirga sp. S365]|uniref:BatA and WFA domain-containing protein n=1 Tax=Rubrivirga litoralis TaxID=3075598 RepID=A0ABU3BLR3_9BACT|nr:MULTISPECIES: BatA and WFA domain-containing protein [unclassified Rubrivirga]MDT0630185.1 BatA and WFA domain-containing protein [Rubrivirga sp. F394]MDT7855696.1 BatA and WFA domain-containing protein [Rubrivirga sp. S365]